MLLKGIEKEFRKKYPEKKVVYWDSEAYVNTFIRNLRAQESKRLYEFKRRNRSADILIFDDFSFLLSGNKTASLQCFFQMINELYMNQKQIIIAGHIPPRDMDIDSRYRSRLSIETAYEVLKDRLKIENFTGIKPILIEQDINSTIYVSNLAEDIICDIEDEDKEHLKNDYKHTMQINRNLSIGLLKNDLIYILIETDEKRKSELLQALYDEIRVNVVPIRPNRHYHRTKGQLAANFSNTHKRSF